MLESARLCYVKTRHRGTVAWLAAMHVGEREKLSPLPGLRRGK